MHSIKFVLFALTGLATTGLSAAQSPNTAAPVPSVPSIPHFVLLTYVDARPVVLSAVRSAVGHTSSGIDPMKGERAIVLALDRACAKGPYRRY